jgi:hypothetical protein
MINLLAFMVAEVIYCTEVNLSTHFIVEWLFEASDHMTAHEISAV